MRKRNRELGQTLPFTLVGILFIILAGVAFAWYSQIFGGSQETKNANDAGILNVNKRAVVDPSVPFDSNSYFQTMQKNCAEPNAKGIDLGSYNRMVSSAMLIAMNASADGTDAAKQNAANIIDELQGSDKSVGAKLKKVLEDPDSNKDWAKKDFESTALSNSVRMAGKDSTIDWDQSLYQVAYLESSSSDTGASNIPVSKLLDNMPLTYDDKGLSDKRLGTPANMVAKDGAEQYLHGYQPIKFPGISRPIFAVPTQPKHQPHLISLNTFSSYLEQPGKDLNVVLPPNGFQGGSHTSDCRTNCKHESNSAGIVGMPADPSSQEARLAQGYLIIDNSFRADYSVTLPNSDTWEAMEAGTGTLVHRSSGVFSSSGVAKGKPYNALESWLQTPRSGSFEAQSGPPINDDDGTSLLYDRNGNAITSKQQAAQLIPYDPSPNSVVLATDRNSDPNGDNPDADAVLHNTPSLPDNLTPFNRAYHPNANAGNGPTSGSNLIAAEQAKLEILNLYGPSWVKGAVRSFNRNFGRTGLRLYPNGLPSIAGPYAYAPSGIKLPMGTSYSMTGIRMPYGDPSVLGKISTDGNIEELFQQTTGTPESVPYVRIDNDANQARVINQKDKLSPAEEVRKFIEQRLKEIKPGASTTEVDLVMHQKLPLGTRWYVYLAKPSDPSSTFVISQNPPTWARNMGADGKRHVFSTAYSIAENMIDAPNDFGIHDHLFMSNHVNAVAVDSASYQASSGANGLLGTIKFFQFVQASGNLKMQ